jgi:arsenate reductase
MVLVPHPDVMTVESRVSRSGSMAGRIRRVALHMGVDLVERPTENDEASLGEVRLPDGCPEWMLEAALMRELRPQHILFLCVANSARSQLAEGIARSLAPDGERVSSAGSVPTSVRPQAVAVLREVGIDISHHTSGYIDDVQRPVHAVVTLCAEEACPVWLEKAWRLHWALPDPAGVEGSDEEKLAAFRAVRDELVVRLGVLFTGDTPA